MSTQAPEAFKPNSPTVGAKPPPPMPAPKPIETPTPSAALELAISSIDESMSNPRRDPRGASVMTTAADLTARIDDLAARVASAPVRKRWPIGPLRRVLYYGVTLDHLECGHRVRAAEHPVPRRHCVFCARGVPMPEGNAIDQARRDGR